MKKAAISILFALLAIGNAYALEDMPPDSCSFGFEEPPFAMAAIVSKAGGKIPMQKETDHGEQREEVYGCPDIDPTNPNDCPSKGHLMPGNVVIKAHDYKQFSCIWHRSRKGDIRKGHITGWIPTAKLHILPAPANPTFKEWKGKWSDGTNSITIQEQDADLLKVHGKAYWHGDHYTNSGGFSALGKPQGNSLKIIQTRHGEYVEKVDDETEYCVVNLTLVGDYLIAKDNSNCGGVNVRFNGVYWHVKH